jgi:hypothetical protein
MFIIVNFVRFFCRFTANQAEIQKGTTDSMFIIPRGCYIPKMTFLAFQQKKPLSKCRKKTRIPELRWEHFEIWWKSDSCLNFSESVLFFYYCLRVSNLVECAENRVFASRYLLTPNGVKKRLTPDWSEWKMFSEKRTVMIMRHKGGQRI